MEGHASISTDILAAYAADAAREVEGVRGLVDGRLPLHRGVRVSAEDGRFVVELHLGLESDAAVPEVGRLVQERVRDYLRSMADVELKAVNVVVAEIG